MHAVSITALRKGAAADDRLIGDDAWTQAILGQPPPAKPAPTLDELINNARERHQVTEVLLASTSRSRKHSAIRAGIALTATEQNIATVSKIARRFGRAHSGLPRTMNPLRDKTR